MLKILIIIFFIIEIINSSKIFCSTEVPIKLKDLVEYDLETAQSVHNFSNEIKCKNFFTHKFYYLKKLNSYLKETHKLKKIINKSTIDDCVNPDKIFGIYNQVVNKNKNKVGIILPKFGKHQVYGKNVLRGFNSSIPENIRDKIIIKDNKSNLKESLKALAELILLDDVSIIVGGLSKKTSQYLAKYTSALNIPYVYLQKDSNIYKKNYFSFQLFQNEKLLAQKLALESHKRGYKIITILQPDNKKYINLITHFRAALKKLNIHVDKIIKYIPHYYESMNNAIAHVTQTLPKLRPIDFTEILEKKQIESIKNGEKFDENKVYLDPKIEADAIFIPDHFQNLRFLIKLLKFHGVKSFPLIGTQHWRSQELVQPWDKFLEGSFFADFVGYYDELPENILTSILRSKYFISPLDTMKIDFRLLGVRLSEIVYEIINKDLKSRSEIFLAMKNQTKISSNQKNIKYFLPNKTSWWPITIFTIHNGSITTEYDKSKVSMK